MTFVRRERQLGSERWCAEGHECAGEWLGMQTTGGDEVTRTGVVDERMAKRHDSGLLAIGIFKLLEAVFFLLVAVGAFHLIHQDLGDATLRLAARLRMDPDGRLVSWVLDHLDDITAHRLRQIGIATIFYAGLRVTEGMGLLLEKLWAEYLTVGVTISFLPWEGYEIHRHPDWIRVGLLVVNLVVVVYLVWGLRRSGRLVRG